MNNPRSFRAAGVVALIPFAIVLVAAQRAGAADALLLQDTYVDNGSTGEDPPPNQSNYGAASDLRVFRGNGRIGRALLQFSLETLPPSTKAHHVAQARLRLWVNANTTAVGSITLTPVTGKWDEYKVTGSSAAHLTLSASQLSDLPIESINSFVSIDLTRWVKAWLDGTLANEGILIEPGANTDFLDLSFDSKESNQTSHEARLEITLRYP
jgi:hypothetical protein